MEVTLEIEELPSPDVNNQNFIDRLKECEDYLLSENWPNFSFLFKNLSIFNESRIKNLAKSNTSSDELIEKYNSLETKATDFCISKVTSVAAFEEYQIWLSHLNDVVKDKKRFWDIIQNGGNNNLKVTLRQAHEIAAAFFTPNLLFEFGIGGFLTSNLCDFSNIANEEALIDIFYAVAGFVRACNLDSQYETIIPEYCDFLQKLLSSFTGLNDFDAHRFVWLIEAIKAHLHISASKFKSICQIVLNEYTNRNSDNQIFLRLHKLCIMSTAPFLQSFNSLRESITSVFQSVLEEQRIFFRKYIFSCFATITWKGNAEPSISDPLKCWKLYLLNLSTKLEDRPELPNLILVDFIEDSLMLFEGYYGDLQPSKARAINMRMEIFTLVDLCYQYYPIEMSDDTLRRMRYLLFIVAVSGASKEELNNIQPIRVPNSSAPYLGLERSDSEFADYSTALSKYSSIFDAEKEDFPGMVSFIRENYQE